MPYNRLPREAVVVVHGIGEQQPLNTLRGFVRAVVGCGHSVFGVPDDVQGRTYVRKLKATWKQVAPPELADLGLRVEPREANTDFFELYWAYQFRDTKAKHVVGWVRPLLLRRRGDLITHRLVGDLDRGALAVRLVLGVITALIAGVALTVAASGETSWGAAIGLVVAALLVLVVSLNYGLVLTARIAAVVVAASFGAGLLHGAGATGGDSAAGLFGTLTALVVPAATGAIMGWVTSSLGDAARYLRQSPDNVQPAEDIRRAALDLLHGLHEKREPSGQYRYDRIVLVGHSLGGVIAYDAVRHLWADRHGDMNLPPVGADGPHTTAVRAVETLGLALDPDSKHEPIEFQQAQHALYRQLRNIDTTPTRHVPSSGRWIVSDLITLGSPLAYADLLMASGHRDLEQRKVERLLTACPPVPQKTAKASRAYRFRAKNSTRLHHGAAFAAVRWTNVYFRHDLIGGPIRQHFGPGVRDLPLGTTDWPFWFVATNPHSNYWNLPGTGRLQWLARRFNGDGAAESLLQLQSLIRRPPVLYAKVTEGELTPEQYESIDATVANVGSPVATDQTIELRLFHHPRTDPDANLPRPHRKSTALTAPNLPKNTAAIGRLRNLDLSLTVSPDISGDPNPEEGDD